MDVAEAIRLKRAIRVFKDEPLPEEAVQKILWAGRRAQSSKNTQPWQFIAITDGDLLRRLSELGTYAGHLAGAAMFDAGQAAAYMQLAAWEMGIGSCIATIYQPEQARELLDFPEAFHLHVALSFGYPADPSALIEPPQAGGRKPMDEIIHWNGW